MPRTIQVQKVKVSFAVLALLASSTVRALEQTFSAVPGAIYVLSFDLAGNPNFHKIKKMGVTVAGIVRTFTFDITGHSQSDMGWTTETIQFTATDARTTVEFYSLDTDGTTAGPTIDNVSVELLRSTFHRGDPNGDGRIDISDPITLLNYLLEAGSIGCLEAADANGDGRVDLSDAVGLLGYIFLGTFPPQPPFRTCGTDAGNSALTCDSYPPCQ